MKKSIIIPRTAHYYLKGNTQNPNRLLLVLHGYGQKAEEFINEFEGTNDPNLLIVAVEGISKFYNKKKEAVCSWMTSHHRLDEINDYINFLNLVVEELQKNYRTLIKIEVLGYSQGTSTATRWATNTHLSINHIYICSGSCPPDLSNFKDVLCNLYFGKKDGIIPLDKGEKEIGKYKKVFNVLKETLFEGGHIISKECLQDLSK